ncbi:hypothetical protein EGR_08174 [Echinococcus granulosus]|nr:hypothetical protein EGR_08174 [Echinococcus granulosus]EUB56937.1 hypothetical protein EGR_08174 [Echinococcus granulosus]
MMDGSSDLIKSTFIHRRDEGRDTLNTEFQTADNSKFEEGVFGVSSFRFTKMPLLNKWNSLECSNSNEDYDCRHKSGQRTLETSICLSPKPKKDVIAEISIDLNCAKSNSYGPGVEDDVCTKCIEVDFADPLHFESHPRDSSLNKASNLSGYSVVDQSSRPSLDEDSIRRTVMSLRENVDEVNRALCSQVSATTIEKQLLEEIQGMKLQLCELSEGLKNQCLNSPPQDLCAHSSYLSKDSKLELSKNIEEIKCHLQQLTAGLGCSSSPPVCPKCNSPCESLKAEENGESEYKSESDSPVMECQEALQCLECDVVTQEAKVRRANINQFLLDKVEGLKTSIDDAIATEKVCYENEKSDHFCAHFATEKDDRANTCTQSVVSTGNQKTSIERIFQILQDLEYLLSSDKSSLNQARALELVCNLKQLLDSEFSNPDVKADDNMAFRELSEKYNCAPPYPIALPPCMMDERRHPDSSSHKGSAASVCVSTISNLSEFPPGKDLNESINAKIKNLLRELYCELQSFDEDIKAKVLSMLEEISETLEALQSCQQTELAASMNLCADCEVQAEPEQFDTCGLPPTPQEEMTSENPNECQVAIMATPNLCSLLTELQNLIKSLQPSAQLSDYDFGPNLDRVLNNLKQVLQTKCNESDILENIGSILKSMEAELCQQGAGASTQAAAISEVEELLMAAGVNFLKEEEYSCESEHSLCCTDGTVPSEMYDEKIMVILDAIERCIREAGSCCQNHVEAMCLTGNEQCINMECSNAPARSCAEEVEYKSPAVACAEAINSRVALILAELKGVVQTLEMEGSTLRDSTISKMFYIFGQIECVLETDRQNASLLMEIKQILGQINGKKMEKVAESIISEHVAPFTACFPPPTTGSEIRESNSRSRNRLSTIQSEGYIPSEHAAPSTACSVSPTRGSKICKSSSQNRSRCNTIQIEAYIDSARAAASTACSPPPTTGSEICRSSKPGLSRSRSRSSTMKSEGYLNRCLNALRKTR